MTLKLSSSVDDVDIEAQLRATNTYFYPRGSHLMVRCPFHADGDPSMRVELYTDRYPRGFFKCWGCGEAGPWNKLAKKLGMKEMQADDSAATSFVDHTAWDSPDDLVAYEGWGLLPWFDFMRNPWRGIPHDLVVSLGCVPMVGHDGRTRLFIPVTIDGTLVGGIAAAMRDSDLADPSYNLPMKKYQNSRGSWVANAGLWPYDYLQESGLVDHYVVLVEGPRDALRLILNGVPALAILGANLGNDVKAETLLAINQSLEHVFLLPDPDNGGARMKKRWTRLLSGKVGVTVFNLPAKKVKLVDELGYESEVDLDPGNMPLAMIRKLKKRIEEKVGAVSRPILK